jgi:hypothetical protein
VIPNMITAAAPAMSPERMFLRASRLSITGNLQLDVDYHRGEQQREVGQRE